MCYSETNNQKQEKAEILSLGSGESRVLYSTKF